MEFIELTSPQGHRLLIRKSDITYVRETEDCTAVVAVGDSIAQEVKESYTYVYVQLIWKKKKWYEFSR